MKKTMIALAALSAITAPVIAVPSVADARPPRTQCEHDRHVAANRGTAAGAIVGAIVGSQVAGRGNRTEGTIIGAAGGAVAGHQIGASTVRCRRVVSYNCRWVRGREVCQNRYGRWYNRGQG